MSVRKGALAYDDATIDALEEAIYKRSEALALQATVQDYLTDECGTYWVVAETRGKAKAFFAGEYGCDFRDVLCRRTYNAVDLQAIRDQAHDIAVNVRQGYADPDDYADHIAYTWEDYGWMWTAVSEDHPRAVALWECTERAR